MIAIVQRVSKAKVSVNDKKSEIGQGYLVYLGITHSDTNNDARKLANKICSLRLFNDEQDKINLSLPQVKGELLVISQFSLHADLKGTNRPSFTKAASSIVAKPLYEHFLTVCKDSGQETKSGFFGEKMLVESSNDGPLTVIIDSTQI